MKTNVVTEYTRPSDYKIENKAITRPRMMTQRYPFDRMKVGQSFYFEPTEEELIRVRSAASQYGKRNDAKFSVIRDGDGYRCGRIE